MVSLHILLTGSNHQFQKLRILKFQVFSNQSDGFLTKIGQKIRVNSEFGFIAVELVVGSGEQDTLNLKFIFCKSGNLTTSPNISGPRFSF